MHTSPETPGRRAPIAPCRRPFAAHALVLLGALAAAGTAAADGTGERAATSPPDAVDAAASNATTAALTRAVRTFPERVVLPAHESLATATGRLEAAAAAFERTPDDATLDAFRRERLRSAVFLARGRAFAFGPVHSLGLDVALDAPIDEAGIDLTIAALDDESVADIARIRRVPSLGGLGAIDHVLETTDDPGSFTAAERRYLHALAQRVDEAAGALRDVWRDGHDGHPAFASVLTTAGHPGNGAYLSVESAAEEIARGLTDTLDVIVHEELPDVLVRVDSLTSRHGVASLALLEAGIDSVRNAHDGAEIGRWLDAADDPDTGASVSGALDDASRAVSAAIAAANDAGAARTALERATASLEQARVRLETDTLPLTRPTDHSTP